MPGYVRRVSENGPILKDTFSFKAYPYWRDPLHDVHPSLKRDLISSYHYLLSIWSIFTCFHTIYLRSFTIYRLYSGAEKKLFPIWTSSYSFHALVSEKRPISFTSQHPPTPTHLGWNQVAPGSRHTQWYIMKRFSAHWWYFCSPLKGLIRIT